MATHYCDKCMATAHLGGEPSKVCDQPPHHFVAVVQPAVGSPRLGSCVFILVGEVTVASLSSNRKRLEKDHHEFPAGLYPLGTTFSVKSGTKNILLTAYHTMTDNYAVERWYITDSVDRAKDGTWSIDIRKLIPVALSDMIPLCPEAEIPLVLDEQLFKTYYCPLGDCMFDKERPTLSIRVSEKKKMTCLKRTDDGRMWFEGRLCAGSSGGAVVDRLGRVVAMHTESRNNDVKTVDDVGQEHNQKLMTGKAKSSTNKVFIDAMSETHDSSVHSYSSSQYCILLSFNALVRSFAGY
eukprot:gene27092-35580_t